MSISLKNIKKIAGMPFFLSVSSTALRENEKKMLREINPSGMIYFKRNVENCDSLKSLIRSMNSIESIRFHAIDEEGGRVRRLPDGPWSLPSMAELADRNVDEVAGMIDVLGQKLNDIGINMNMAPNVDLRSGENISIVGNRSFGETPQKVTEFASIYVENILKNGVFPVLKHFPGHGTTTVDSHKALPVINKPFNDLYNEDMLPYRELANRAGFIMAAHLLHNEISELPATLSREWMEILKIRCGFNGIAMTDDMEMHALDKYSFYEKMDLFYRSGIDMLLVCSGNEDVIMNFFEASVKYVEKNNAVHEKTKELNAKMNSKFNMLKSLVNNGVKNL
ncbi:MAG TPA: glycoside hydrolase family 3 N-terminal domain-containing protein [bacterium]|nr:glycoside hydrolase family 3 N-terminal domain-containing protein [bacterium]HPS30278.1 glycoside hydrolase family 3 N-terminal domain-containing protein [bacterium]